MSTTHIRALSFLHNQFQYIHLTLYRKQQQKNTASETQHKMWIVDCAKSCYAYKIPNAKQRKTLQLQLLHYRETIGGYNVASELRYDGN